MFCLPETAGPVCRQVRACVSIIKAGVEGACGSGLGDVSMPPKVMVRVGRMAVRARGLDRACVCEGGLGLKLVWLSHDCDGVWGLGLCALALVWCAGSLVWIRAMRTCEGW